MNIRKIFEIIDTDIETAYYSKPFQNPENPMPDTGLETDDPRYDKGVRAGSFSQVKQNKNDPHTVTKRSKKAMNPKERNFINDLFGEFVEFINENKKFDNIYIPKVYSFKKIKDPNNNIVYKYQIEKLNEIQDLSKKEIEFLIEKILKTTEDKNITTGKELAQFINDIVGDYINKNDSSKIQKYIKDDQFVEAANIIKKFIDLKTQEKENRKTLFDRSWTNLMFRNTPYGPQLVFADPVFDKKAFF